jgi:NADPH2:quinone reductase
MGFDVLCEVRNPLAIGTEVKAIRFEQYGDPGVLEPADVPTPAPGPGEVLIRVESVGINYADTARRRNQYLERTPLPFVLGGEIAGTVEALGPGVSTPAPGTRVGAVIGSGAYAQFAVVPAAQATPIPAGIDDDTATVLFVQGLTAYLIFRGTIAPLKTGESVLIQGAAGGVGCLAVQIAKLLGAGRVIALAGSEEKRTFVQSLGADAAVDYTQPEWPKRVLEANGGTGVDLVLEIAGGEAIAGDLEALAPWGRIVVYGNASRTKSQIDPTILLYRNRSVIGFWLTPYFSERMDAVHGALGELTRWVESGALKPHVGLVLPLAEAARAHTLLEGRATMGKVVLKPWR